MSFKAVSAVVGSITAIGGGLGIYFFNNSKNNTNNPPQKSTDNLEKNLPSSFISWKNDLRKMSGFSDAEATGKIFNFVTYKDSESADKNSKYYLIKVTENYNHLSSLENIQEVQIKKDGVVFFEINNDGNSAKKTINVQNLPFYYFEDSSNTSLVDLNFKKLKKCQKNNCLSANNQYLVIKFQGFNFFNQEENTALETDEDVSDDEGDESNKENNSFKKGQKIELEFTSLNASVHKTSGLLESIFKPEYQPEFFTE